MDKDIDNTEQRGIPENVDYEDTDEFTTDEFSIQDETETTDVLFLSDEYDYEQEISISEEDNLSEEEESLILDEKKTIQKTPRQTKERVLTINAHDDISLGTGNLVWYEIVNAYRAQKVLTGILSGSERTRNGIAIAIVSYKKHRVAIPINKMNISDLNNLSPEENMQRKIQILNLMLGAEIDFVISGIDNKAKSCVANRSSAMRRKRHNYYIRKSNENNLPLIYESRVVQGRIISILKKGIRVEVFGVETVIFIGNLAHWWLGDLKTEYNVGDKILVKIEKLNIQSVDKISIEANIKDLIKDESEAKLDDLVIQGRYTGTVVDVRKGITYVKLNNGVVILAGISYDTRTAGVNDLVSCTLTNVKNSVFYGIITRIIKQNL